MFSFSNNDSYFVDLTRTCAAKMMDSLEVWKHFGASVSCILRIELC